MDPMNSTMSVNFTYSSDKYSCIREMYFVHVTMAYFVTLSGIGCFITRIFARLRWIHKWFGKLYVISMLWCTGTSLLIHNDGLPLAVLIAFVWVLLGLSVGWLVIGLHQVRLQKEALKNIQEKMNHNGIKISNLQSELDAEKAAIIQAKPFLKRMFSLKGLHGTIMFISWYNIAGRIFASNQSGDFTCFTYPAYKQVATKHGNYTDQPITWIPIHSDNYAKLPWANSEGSFGALALIVPCIFGVLFGLAYVRVSIYYERKEKESAQVVAILE